jgi:hypothetical protein
MNQTRNVSFYILIAFLCWALWNTYGFGALKIGDPWYAEKYYKSHTNISMAVETVAAGFYLPPINFFTLTYLKIAGRDRENVEVAIQRVCKNYGDTADKILCIIQYVSQYTHSLQYFGKGITYDGRTICATAANLFKTIYNSMEIPGSYADFHDWTEEVSRPHVVNTIFFTSTDGQIFSYVTDVRTFSGVLFPLSDAAIKFHDPNADDTTDITFLPTWKLSKPGRMVFRAAEPDGQASGTQVSRRQP